VQELVRLHGGTIGVQSELGCGSVFTVRMPIASDAAHDAKALHPLRPEGSHRSEPFVREALSWLPAQNAQAEFQSRTAPRVLVADDNADLREYVRKLLAERYEVEAVEDGLAALAAAHARRPDLIVADVMMPRLDGIGLIRALRADDR